MLARAKWQVPTIAVLEEVFEERARQVARYGHNEGLEDGTGPSSVWIPDTLMPGSAAINTEADLRADYERHEAETGAPTWMHLVREEVAEAFKEADPARLEEELIQVAALCISWVEKIRARG